MRTTPLYSAVDAVPIRVGFLLSMTRFPPTTLNESEEVNRPSTVSAGVHQSDALVLVRISESLYNSEDVPLDCPSLFCIFQNREIEYSAQRLHLFSFRTCRQDTNALLAAHSTPHEAHSLLVLTGSISMKLYLRVCSCIRASS